MKVVERHAITKSHPLWSEIDQYAFLSKNLFNLANYHYLKCRGEDPQFYRWDETPTRIAPSQVLQQAALNLSYEQGKIYGENHDRDINAAKNIRIGRFTNFGGRAYRYCFGRESKTE